MISREFPGISREELLRGLALCEDEVALEYERSQELLASMRQTTAGYAALLLYHVTVSVGMVVRLLPIMGIPLPLMSFGRSSVLATFFGLGLAMNVRLRRFVN